VDELRAAPFVVGKAVEQPVEMRGRAGAALRGEARRLV
jgi:hypothetical protein